MVSGEVILRPKNHSVCSWYSLVITCAQYLLTQCNKAFASLEKTREDRQSQEGHRWTAAQVLTTPFPSRLRGHS